TLKHAVDSGCFKLRAPTSSAPAAAGLAGSPAAPASATALPYGPGGAAELNMTWLLTSLLEVAAGLRHLHEQRLVHCDVKPSNVLLRSCASDARGWTCKLSDFGCVRLLTDLDPASGRPVFQALSPVGSLSYMAPESMSKDVALDASIDIYAMGVM
ncbi:Serine/threonine-protein kinase dkf-2, partial [Tetrabaena socialis]